MSRKYLIVAKESNCNGCNLCALAAARAIKNKIGIQDSPISVKGRPGLYRVQVDYGVEIKSIDKIINICPQNVFDQIEEE